MLTSLLRIPLKTFVTATTAIGFTNKPEAKCIPADHIMLNDTIQHNVMNCMMRKYVNK